VGGVGAGLSTSFQDGFHLVFGVPPAEAAWEGRLTDGGVREVERVFDRYDLLTHEFHRNSVPPESWRF
jgi:hypothetical protein